MAKKTPKPQKGSKKTAPKVASKPVPFIAKQSKIASKIYSQYPDRFKNYAQARSAASQIIQSNNGKTRGLTDKKLDYGIRGWTKSQPKPKSPAKPKPFIAKQSKIASKIYREFPDRFNDYSQARKAATTLLHENNDNTRGLKNKTLDYGLRKIKREQTIAAAEKKKPARKGGGVQERPVLPKKKGTMLTEINQHASELYKEHPEWFQDYHEAQRASAAIMKGKYGEVEGVSETKFDEAVERWREENAPEEEEEGLGVPELPKVMRPDLPGEFLTSIPYWDLDDRFQSIQKHILDLKNSEDPLNDVYVISLTLTEAFDAISYNYNNVWKEYVDWMNEQGFDKSPGFAMKFDFLPDETTGKWYILVEEDVEENEGPSGYSPSGSAEETLRRISPVERELGRKEPKVLAEEKLSEAEKKEKLDNLVNERELLRSVKTEKQADRASQLEIIRSLKDSLDPKEQELVRQLRDSNVQLSREIDEISRQEALLTRRIGVK